MVDLGSIAQVPMLGGILKGLTYAVIAMIAMGLIGVTIWVFVKRKKHNIPVIIISERAGQRPKIVFDQGGYFKRKGRWIFSILKYKKIIPPPDTKYLQTGAKGLNILILHQKSIDDFIPVYFDFPSTDIRFRVADMDTQLWADSMKELLQKTFMKQSWFQKYGSYVMFGVAGVLCIVLIYVVLQKFDTISAGLGGIANALKYVAQSVGENPQIAKPI